MTAGALSAGVAAWPAVQIVFVLETDPYDGVFDRVATNASYYNSYPSMCNSLYPLQLCYEANTVEAFIANASAIAYGLQAVHPLSRVSFGLVDYFATHDQWGDTDGAEYHVDIGALVNASDFAGAIRTSLQTRVLNGSYILPNSTLSDNFLHSSSITALYGTLMGAGIRWASDTHHVIVWIGSTVPRDPNFVANYCQTVSTHVPKNISSPTDPRCYSPSCEPSYNFGGGITSPRCEGWIAPQDGNASDSIAQLAFTAPNCVNSLGGSCTIDTIDTNAGASFGANGFSGAFNQSPLGSATSLCWSWGNGPPSPCSKSGLISDQQYWQTGNRTLAAACDLSVATGGSWDGTRYWDGWNTSYDWYYPYPAASCDGVNGTLWWYDGPASSPTAWTGPCDRNSTYQCDVGREFFLTANLPLIGALTSLSFGRPPDFLSLAAPLDGPLFTFLPWGSFQAAPYLDLSIRCERSSGYPTACPTGVETRTVDGVSALEFNWSSDPNLNSMQPGDVWTASFNVVATGPPFGAPTPVDACTTQECLGKGSGAIGGDFTWVSFLTPNSTLPTRSSFPLAEITVEPLDSSPPPPTSTAPPPPPGAGAAPPVPVPAPVPTPVTVPVAAAVVATVQGLSLSAAAAGILAAGIARVVIQGRRSSVAVLNRLASGRTRSRSVFELDRQEEERAMHKFT